MMGIIAFCYNTKTATRYFTGVIPTKTTHKKQTLPMDSSKNNNEQRTFMSSSHCGNRFCAGATHSE